MEIEYSSNNSGGSWWLKDEDWKALEAAGWWVGLAKCAKKDFTTVKEALEEFERITGENVSDEGCNCCGAPHSFFWEGGYCSGEDCLQYLYSNVPSNLREAVEMLNKGAA